MKYCNICHELKEYKDFYKNVHTKDGYNCYCKECQLSKYKGVERDKNRKIKEYLVKLAGGKCCRCGYDKCIAALDFHHRDPNEKEFTMGEKVADLDALVEEIKKCDLLCVNCHREEHYNNYNVNEGNYKIEGDTKKCSVCHKIKPITEFYRLSNSKDGYHSRCKYCKTILDMQRQRKNKKELVDMLGGKCCRCGYDKCVEALDFHHRNPNNKLFEIAASKYYKSPALLEEIKKCDLLCANCHREEHYNRQK